MRIAFLIIFCSHFITLGFSQSLEQQRDSLLNIIKITSSDSVRLSEYFNLAQLNLYKAPLKTIEYCNNVVDLGLITKDHLSISNAYVLRFNAQLYYGAPSDSLLLTIKTLESLVNDKLEEEDMLRVYWIYALYYGNIRQFDKQIEAYIKALEIATKYDADSDLVAGLLGSIGDLLLEQGKYEEALEYFEEALLLTDDPIGRGTLLQGIGIVLNHQGKYDDAFASFKKAYTYQEKGKDIKGMALALIEQGKYYERDQAFERAGQIYTQVLDLVVENNVGSLLPKVFVTIAEHQQHLNNHRAAIQYGEQALSEIKLQQNYENLNQTYSVLQESYAAVEDYKRAFDLRGEQLVYKDSVNNSELRTNIEALKTEFEVEKKETENQLLKAEAEANQQTIQSKNITALALMLGMLLLGSWAIVIFRSNRRKQKYSKELEATVADRTNELKQANKDLAQANYELKTFNYIASHDIKEPIRNIGNYAGLIFRKLPVEMQLGYKEYFENVKNSTSQLYTLVEDFSKYTQLSKGSNIDMKQVDLDVLINTLDMNLNNFSESKRGVIINKGLPSVWTNSSLLYTILKKLIENGLKFNHSSVPTVTISSKDNNDYTEVILDDNGIGIAPEYHDQIFDMFKRLHHREEYSGSGIGLAIVKLLAEKLNVGVLVESTLKQGSTFILQIPKRP